MNPSRSRGPSPGTPLPFQTRAELFRQLGALEGAGMPVDRALALLRVPSPAQPRLARMRQSLALGFGVADAGQRGGLFTPLETALLRVAFDAGTAELVYRTLADQYARRAARLARLKSRMALPLAMVAASIVLNPIPALIAGTAALGATLLAMLGKLLLLAVAAVALTELPRLRSGGAAPRDSILASALVHLPLFGPMAERRGVRDFFESLALLVEAGMPILQALPIANDTIREPGLRRRFAGIASRIRSGQSFAGALGERAFIGSEFSLPLLVGGESSGGLPETLQRCARAESDRIEQFDDAVAVWLPRLVYTGSALALAYGILHSGAFSRPADPDTG